MDHDPQRAFYDRLSNLTYGRAGKKPLLLDLYLPRDIVPPLATVLYLHGGGWHKGAKTPCPAEPLLHGGFAVACANYRLSGVAPFPAQLHDARAAVRWLRKNSKRHGLATKKLGVWGLSAGAHLACMLGTAGRVEALRQAPGEDPELYQVQAVAAWFPPTDFLSVDFRMYTQYGDAVKRLLRLSDILELKAHTRRARLASPIYHVSRWAAPTLLIHGQRDTVVPLEQSRALHQALKTAGIASTLRVVVDAAHGPGFTLSHEKAVGAFFQEHLRDSKPARPKLGQSQLPGAK